MKRVSFPINFDRRNYNNANVHENDPYVSPLLWGTAKTFLTPLNRYIISDMDTLLVDLEWWKSLDDAITGFIQSRLSLCPFNFGIVETPHSRQNDKRLTQFYRLYQEAHDYQRWYYGEPSGVKIVPLSALEKVALSEARPDDLEELKKGLRSVLDSEQQFFVKTSCTSGKNQKEVEPFMGNNIDGILNHLMTVEEFRFREFDIPTKTSCLIFVPWNPNIEPRKEFRMFVVNRKVTGASPQRWWDCHNYSSDELDVIEKAILNASVIKMSTFDTFVADIYIDFETEQAKLIEVNCFGDHSGAGASLFNWIDDHDLLYGLTGPPELRFVSAVSIN